MSVVYFANGAVFAFMGMLMVLDAILFPQTARDFGAAGLLAVVLGTSIAMASRSRAQHQFADIRRVHTFVLTATVWLSAAIAGGMPLAFWGMGWTDAFFESMSGITTTGSTVMQGLDLTPHGILLWRAVLQALGGIGFVVAGIALLPVMRVGGMQLFRTESSDKSDNELNSAARFATATLYVYMALIGVCAVVYAFGGMSPFDAIVHALTTLSTGGYSNYDASFGHFTSPFLQWAATFFMLLGSLPFAWYIAVLAKGRVRSEQVTAFLIGLVFVVALLTVWLVSSRQANLLDALRLVAFNVISVVSTTGYATADYTLWGPFAVTIFMAITAIGGCTGSTAGGVKVMRWLIFVRSLKAQIARVHSPHVVVSPHYEGKAIAPDVVDGIIFFFSAYFVTFAMLSMALGFVGLDFQTAVSGALTSLANVGPGVGAIIGPAGNFAPLPESAKNLLSFGMYLGRLELMTVFVLFAPAYWREI